MHYSFLILFLVVGCATVQTKISRAPSNDGNLESYKARFSRHAVSLMWKGEQFCSGFLVSHNKVLSAAHCLREIRLVEKVSFEKNFDVLVEGKSIKSGEVQAFVSKDFDFEEERPKNAEGDIAVFLLKGPSEASLQFDVMGGLEFQNGDQFVTMGFGPNPDLRKPSPYKPEGSLNVTEVRLNEESDQELRFVFLNGPVGQGIICGGDSGSPLFLVRKNQIYLMGVLSASIYPSTDADEEEKEEEKDPEVRALKARMQCAKEVGVSYWTSAQEYLRFIQDPAHEGVQIKFANPARATKKAE